MERGRRRSPSTCSPKVRSVWSTCGSTAMSPTGSSRDRRRPAGCRWCASGPMVRVRDVLPDGFNARTSAHEYGGGAVLVASGTVWFVNWADQRLYAIVGDAAPVPLTAEPAAKRSVRWADLRLSPDGAWIVCVRETHDGEHADQVRNELVALRATEQAEPVVLFGGATS